MIKINVFPSTRPKKRVLYQNKNVLLRGHKNWKLKQNRSFFTKSKKRRQYLHRDITRVLLKDEIVLWYCALRRWKGSKKMGKRRIETNLSRDVAQMRLIMSTNRQTNKWIKISILLLFDIPNVLCLTVTVWSPAYLRRFQRKYAVFGRKTA